MKAWIIILAVAGCNGGTKDTDVTDTGTPADTDTDTGTVVEVIDLDGIWQGDCVWLEPYAKSYKGDPDFEVALADNKGTLSGFGNLDLEPGAKKSQVIAFDVSGTFDGSAVDVILVNNLVSLGFIGTYNAGVIAGTIGIDYRSYKKTYPKKDLFLDIIDCELSQL